MIKKSKRIIALFLSALLITSCGKKSEVPPELIKPIASNESYVTVERDNIGKVYVKKAVVTPTTYCHFWKTSVAIKEIKVREGDHVKAGDVLAVADTEYVEDNIATLQRELQFVYSENATETEKYNKQIEELEYRIQGAEDIGDMAMLEEAEKNLELVNENLYYCDLLFNHRVNYINKAIAELSEVLEDVNLVARHDGVVGYTLKLEDRNIANKEANVVVVVDNSDTYLRMEEETPANQAPFEDTYAMINNERHEIEEIQYSANELAVMKSKKLGIKKRYKFADGYKMPDVGHTVFIIQKREHADNVICVSNESVYEDEQGSFVYVKSGDKNEKKYVEVGMHDSYMTEIKSGLEEGEKVFFKSNATVPESAEELAVEVKDFKIEKTVQGIVINTTNCVVESVGCSGRIKKIATDGYKCSAGEVIAQIETSEGGASLLEQRTRIEEFQNAHQDEIDAFNGQLDALKQEIEIQQRFRENPESFGGFYSTGGATETDAISINETDRHIPTSDDVGESDERPPIEIDVHGTYYLEELMSRYDAIMLDFELCNLRYDYNLGEMQRAYQNQCENNDGSGIIQVKAKADGTVKRKYKSEGDEIFGSTNLFAFGYKAPAVVEVGEKLVTNSKIKFKSKEKDLYDGTVSYYNDSNDYYVSTIDGLVYITRGSAKKPYTTIKTDEGITGYVNASGLKASGISAYMDKVIVIPAGAVYDETNRQGETIYYVWTIKDGTYTKKYIQCEDFDGATVVIDGLKSDDVVAYEQ